MRKVLCFLAFAYVASGAIAFAQNETDVWRVAQGSPLPEEIAKPNQASPQYSAPPHRSRPIGTLGVDVGLPEGELPRDYAIEHGVTSASLATVAQRAWPMQTRSWVAPAMRTHPLYFEEVNAERYGYTCSRCFQPVISTVHFFGTVPYLPYLMATNCPRSCVYTLGHYRPGSCVPYRKHAWPISIRGVSAEAVTAVGLVAIIP